MNSYYLGRSALECLSKANGRAIKGIWRLNTASAVCDLAPSASTMTLFASLLTSFGMLMFKAAKVEVLSLKIKEGHQLRKEREELVAPPQGIAPAPIGQQHAAVPQLPAGSNGPIAGHSAPGAANHAVHIEPEFVGGGHVAPLALGPALPSMQNAHPANLPHPVHPPPAAVNVPHPPHTPAHPHQQAPAKHALPHPQLQAPAKHAPAHPQAQAPAKHAPVPAQNPPTNVRGICDGCGENVIDEDNGRVREGDKYYHAACIRGSCGGCHLIVHANAERQQRAGVYWHNDCWAAATHH